MLLNGKTLTRTSMSLALLMVASILSAQDEVRLTDGGVLEGKIIRETETEVELKHKSFGVIKIPRSKVERMGAYGTLDAAPEDEASRQKGRAEGAPARPDRRPGPAASRLDLDYEPERFQPVPVPGAEETDDEAALEAEMEARPDLARLYETLINRDVIKEDSAELLLSLNEKWEADPGSLSLLENRIVEALMGKPAEADAANEDEYRNPPPVSLAPVVDEIRSKLGEVGELSYSERYSVETAEGSIVLAYERQVSRPDLIAGTGKVLEHTNADEEGKAVRYFGDGQMLWLLMRGASGRSGEDDRGPNPFGVETDGPSGDTPQGTRADFSSWAAAGFPIERIMRADLPLAPFESLDLATLELVSEDEQGWVLKARVDSPAFEPMESAELRIARSTGLLESMELTGENGSASLEIQNARIDPEIPPATFVVPEAPEGGDFQVVKAPRSAEDALSMLGAL